MNKWILILVVSLLMCLSISPVLAVDYSGNFTRTDAVTTNTWSIILNLGNDPGLITKFQFTAIENYQTLFSIYYERSFSDYTWDYSGGRQSYSTYVDAYIGSNIVGNGTFGFNNNSASGKVQIFFYPTTWDMRYTGTQTVTFSDPSDPAGFLIHGLKDLTYSEGKYFHVVGDQGAWQSVNFPTKGYNGVYILLNRFVFKNNWDLDKTGNVITARVLKTVDGMPYKSRVYLFQNDSTIITSDLTQSFTDFDRVTITMPLKIAVLDSHSNWYNTSYYYGGSGTYSITLDPSEISPTASTTGTIISSADLFLSSIVGLTWEWSDSTGVYPFYESGNVSRPLDYNLQTGIWYGFDKLANDYRNNKGTTIPNPVTLSGITSTGTKTVICSVFLSDGNYYKLTAPLSVGTGAGASGRVLIRAIDWRTNDQVSGADINIKTLANNTWSNLTTVTGRREYFTPIGSRLYLEGYKSGYDRASIPMYLVEGLMDSQTISMFPTGSGSTTIENTTLYVSTYNANTYDLRRGVTVTIRNDGQVKVTDNSGTVSFTVINGSSQTVRAGCSANDCTAQIKTETVTGSAYTMQFYLESLYATTIPTVAPGQTAVPTAAPTLDMRTNEQKGEGMVKMLYDNGESIVMLCILMTIFGLLGFRFGK